MGKRYKGCNKDEQSHAATLPRMTKNNIAKVKTWLERMQINVSRAIDLSNRMSRDEMVESNDLFWALAKYTENVQESAKELDRINEKIYPALIEFDMDTWQALKGMRDVLVHQFWNINSQILLSTVTEDFPVLLSLLSTIIVFEKPIDDGESVSLDFETERLLGLPDIAPGSAVVAGQGIICLVFGHRGKVGVIRVGHYGTGKLLMHANFNTRVTVFGQRNDEDPWEEVGTDFYRRP